MITSNNIKKHELIGLDVEVVDSINKDLCGLKGKVVDETRNLIVVATNKGEKKVLKKDATFMFKLENEKVEVDGKVLVGRPEERLKK